MSQRYLIVNGDDFGVSEEVNEAVILAHRRGILTSCSLMPGGAAVEGAVRLARENPGLAVGIHVACVAGKSVLPHREIPHVVDRDGNFPADPALAGLKYFFCKRSRKELFREITAQFEKFCASGLRCSHIDSHCHMHVNPAVFGIVAELGEQYGIRRMRVPDDDFFAAVPFLPKPLAAAGYALVFKLLAALMRTKLRGRGFGFASRVYGNLLTGNISREYVLSALDKVPPGVSEIYFHPALLPDPGPDDPKKVQLLRELVILLDPEVRSKIDTLGILPANYLDLDRF
ncbi:MAG: hopanoid biosynthesis-associated protein HpnK [Syntrophobacteraceae bacterium]